MLVQEVKKAGGGGGGGGVGGGRGERASVFRGQIVGILYSAQLHSLEKPP